MDFEQIEKWAASHETSNEVAIATHDFCEGDEFGMSLIFEDPKDNQSKIVEAAWRMVAKDTKELFWGITTLHRDLETVVVGSLGPVNNWYCDECPAAEFCPREQRVSK